MFSTKFSAFADNNTRLKYTLTLLKPVFLLFSMRTLLIYARVPLPRWQKDDYWLFGWNRKRVRQFPVMRRMIKQRIKKKLPKEKALFKLVSCRLYSSSAYGKTTVIIYFIFLTEK